MHSPALEELEHLLADLESDRVERKESLGDGEAVRKAICAFANDLPGHRGPGLVFIGVADDGGCRNIEITDELLKRLADIGRDGSIIPLPHLTVQRRTIRSCEVAVVQVFPAEGPPVRWRQQAWVRVGPTSQAASAQQERVLSERRRGRDLPFDIQRLPSAPLNELDADLFRSHYRPAYVPNGHEDNRPIEEQLAAVRFSTAGDEPRPTVLGILCLSHDPARYVPGAYVQFLRFGENDMILDQKAIGGPLVECMARCEELLELNIQTATEITSAPVEIRRPDYPLAALQQMLRNALMHRSYDASNAPIRVNWRPDSVEIQNPGGPFGQVTRETFGSGLTDYRNPNLPGVFKDLGYVQKFGLGIQIARESMRQNGNLAPEFAVEPLHVQVTLRRKP